MFRYYRDNNFKTVYLYSPFDCRGRLRKEIYFFPKNHIIFKTKAMKRLKKVHVTGERTQHLIWCNSQRNHHFDMKLLKYHIENGELNHAIMEFGESYGKLAGIKIRVIGNGTDGFEVEKGLSDDTVREICKTKPILYLYWLENLEDRY